MRRAAHLVGLAEVACLVGFLAGAPTGADVFFAVFLAVTLGVGWVLASRLPRHPMGWLLLTIAGFFLLGWPTYTLGTALLDSHPGVAAWLLWYGREDDQAWIWLPPVGLLFTQVLLRFPDGRLPSPGWRWFSRASAVILGLIVAFAMTAGGDVAPGLANPTGIPWMAQQEWLVPVLGLPLLMSFAGSAVSVIVRYRRAGAVERTQIRWFAWAAGFAVGLYLVSIVLSNDALNTWVGLSYALIPASIGVAVLRYRLYAIDRIISRTLAYAAVTGTVLATYALVVTSVTRALPVSSSLAVAVATLAAAAVFRPVLRRVQTVVDRRFNREHYDAERIVDAFGARLRSDVDPDAAAADLLAAVGRTLEPGAVGLWVPGRPR